MPIRSLDAQIRGKKKGLEALQLTLDDDGKYHNGDVQLGGFFNYISCLFQLSNGKGTPGTLI